MRLVELISPQYRVVVAGLLLCALVAASSSIAWKVQDWRYGQQLEKQSRLHTETLNQITLASAALQRTEQDKRLALEQRLAANDQTHYRALTDAQRDQDRLRDRLATADVRLSVLLDATDTANGCAVPATAGTGGVVYGATRARLDPAHAQRIIGITDAGDRAVIALQACQGYVRSLNLQGRE
ncbi:Bacteriophage Rz lysis protein [Pseudomonas sp. NFACC23-1]|uniref:lysis system i-spanin subunit Rz n=1 Tax=unclassified Pseudomonas TaxID=196821 RepID=UPI0008850945|nr:MULTISPECIES: lysis system i-spanin subunit Rz [unclassified Pseudomonas]SDB18323.1 Bacteriophage Rz lysis protein [Pseudomonas sp. NFACC17-2]SEJ23127.1 Bacteriophage Rz lysis protein [Pseudomonas sp. NFACC23-1]SFW91902.1 Bacteriophage Rz lysis protein [Pseudomonas sp. NFACC16-2]